MKNLNLFNSFLPTKKSPLRSGKNAVIYTRVSHVSQEENTSLETQKKYCENFALRKGLSIIEYFGGTYESAKTDDRKEFSKMLQFIKRNKKINYIIVYSYERFSRSGIEGAKIANDLLKDYNIKTLAVTQELDPSTYSGMFQQNIFFLFSQMDNELRRDKSITGMKELIRKGYCTHNVPRGYINLNKGKAVNQQIVVNEDGEFIRKAFLWKVNEKMNNVDIVRKLNSLGFKINEKALSYLLSNPFYCGIITSSLVPDEVIIGNHQPMISQELFLKANNIIQSKRFHPFNHTRDNNNLPLKIFMKCICGKSMTGYLVKKKNLFYYKCPNCCANKSAKNLHEQFENLLSPLQLNTQIQFFVEEGIKTIFKSTENEKLSESRLYNIRKNTLLQKIEALEERFAIGEISESLFLKYKTKFENEIEEVENRNNPITFKMQSTSENCIAFSKEIAQNPKSFWINSSIEFRSTFQSLLFPYGIIYNKNTKSILIKERNIFYQPELVGDIEVEKSNTYEFKAKSTINFPNNQFDHFEYNFQDKWTVEYICAYLNLESCSIVFYEKLIRFMEDYCRFIVSAYLHS